MNNGKIKIVTVLLMGLIGGCYSSNNYTPPPLPPGVQGYVPIDQFANDDRIPQVAFDGTNYLVVYEETLPGHDIIGALVSPSGAVLGGSSFFIDDSPNDDLAPAVAFDGTNYLVVYQRMNTTDHEIIGTFVSLAGVPSAPFAIDNSPNDDLAPAVAFDGTNYLVVYEETVSSTDHNIIGAQVSPAGVVLGGSPFAIDNSGNDDLTPKVTFGGGNYLAVYQETVSSTDHNIVGALVSTAGSPGSPFAIDSSANDDLAPAVAFDGTNYLAVYQRTANPTNHDIIGAFVSSAGVPGPPSAIDNTTFDDLVPAIAFDGTNYLVVYQETLTSTNRDIIGTRVSPGGIVDPNVVLIDTSGADDLVPAVAFGITNYLVAYEEIFSSTDHDIFGARVTP